MEFHCSFYFPFPDSYWYWTTTVQSLPRLYYFFWEISIQIIYLLNWILAALLLNFCSLCFLGINTPSDTQWTDSLSCSLGCFFTLLIISFVRQKLCSLGKPIWQFLFYKEAWPVLEVFLLYFLLEFHSFHLSFWSILNWFGGRVR